MWSIISRVPGSVENKTKKKKDDPKASAQSAKPLFCRSYLRPLSNSLPIRVKTKPTVPDRDRDIDKRLVSVYIEREREREKKKKSKVFSCL